MALFSGTVKLGGIISPQDTTDQYAVFEDTYGRGGYRVVSGTTERDDITSDRRKLGMMVYVTGTSTAYVLTGATNDDWMEFTTSSPGGSESLTGLTDVTISSPLDGQSLVYDSGTSQWINSTASGTGVSDHGALTGLLDNDHPQYRLTATTINFSEIGSTGHNHTVSEITDFDPTDYTTDVEFDAHTADTNYHFLESSIDFANISNTGHTHTEFDAHTGLSNIHFTVDSIEYSAISQTAHTHEFSIITNTGHNHTVSEISDFDPNDYTTGVEFTAHTGDTDYHFLESSIDFSNISNTGHTHDLSNLNQNGASHSQVIAWNSGTSQWEATDPVIATGDTALHNSLDGLQGGQASQYYHLTSEEWTSLRSGSANADALHSHDFSGITNTAHTHAHSATTGLQGGTTDEYYHLTAAEHLHLTGFTYASNEPTGFINTNQDATLSFSAGNRTLTITPTGSTFDVMVKGVLYQKTEDSIQIDNTTGLHHVVYDDTGTLTSLGTSISLEDIIYNNAYVANIFWNTGQTTAAVGIGDERHGAQMDAATHAYLHTTVGSQYLTGLALQGITADGSGDLDSSAVVGVGYGQYRDEDIIHTIAETATGATIPVVYMSGTTGTWWRNPPRIHPVMTGGTGRLLYNNFVTSWSLVEASNGYYVIYHFFATNDISTPMIAIPGQNQYNNLSNARAAAPNEIGALVTEGLPGPEFLPIGSVIYQTNNVYANQSKARIVSDADGNSWIDFRTSKITAVSNVNDHGGLGGLGDDDHIQYHNDARATTWIEGKNHTVLSATTITGGTVLGVDFSDVLNTGHTHTESEISDLQDYALQTDFTAHTTSGSVHFTEASIDHTNIQNIGTNSHTDIDNHIASGSVHFTEASIDIANIVSAHTHDYHSDLTNTGHTHLVTDITDFDPTDYSTLVQFTAHTGDTDYHFLESSIDFANISNTAHTHDYAATSHTHNPSGGTILSGGAIDGQILVWRDSIDAWSAETNSSEAVTSHTGLTDMPDTGGTNTDHDVRYVPAISGSTPALPTPYAGMFWLDTGTTATATVLKQRNKKIAYIETPAANEAYPIMSVQFNCSITRITYKTDTGTVTFNLEERTETDPETSGTTIYSSDQTAGSTMSATTSFSNSGITADNWLYFSASTVSGSPTKLWLGISYEED